MRVRKPLHIFFAVEKALFLRELNMKFTVGKMGLFWTFFQPFMQIAAFLAIHALLSPGKGNYDYTVFLAVGFIAFNMFRNILGDAMGAFTANKGLFVYKQVKPIDTIIARVMVEVFITSIIILMFASIGFFFHYDIKPQNLLMVSLGFIWLILFSFSIGLLAAIGNTFYVSIGNFIRLTSFLLLFASGVFYTLVSVPAAAQKILLYNPVLHFLEMIHGYYILQLDTRFVDYRYMVLWTIVPLFIGIWLYKKLEKRIVSE